MVGLLAVASLAVAGFWLRVVLQPSAQPVDADAPGGAAIGRPADPANQDHEKGPQSTTVAALPKLKDHRSGEPLTHERSTPTAGGDATAALLAQFEASHDPASQHAIARQLAVTGDVRVMPAFAKVLTNTYTGFQLTREAVDDLTAIAGMMGELARAHESALAFLLSGIEPEFWQTHSGWVSPYTADEQTRVLIGMCLASLGASGRTEAALVLEEYRTGRRDVSRFYLAGPVVDAAFALSEAKRRQGRTNDSRTLGEGEDYVRRFQAWLAASEGRAWREWSQRVRGIPDKSTNR